MNKKLKDCPLCGSIDLDLGRTNKNNYMIECNQCGIKLVNSHIMTLKMLWNTREKSPEYIKADVNELVRSAEESAAIAKQEISKFSERFYEGASRQ